MPVLWHQRTYEISNFLLYILEIRNSGFYGRFLKHDLARQILSVPVSLQGCSRPTRILNELTNCCDRSIPYPFGVYAAMCLYVLMWLYICISNGPFMLNLANTESYHIIWAYSMKEYQIEKAQKQGSSPAKQPAPTNKQTNKTKQNKTNQPKPTGNPQDKRPLLVLAQELVGPELRAIRSDPEQGPGGQQPPTKPQRNQHSSKPQQASIIHNYPCIGPILDWYDEISKVTLVVCYEFLSLPLVGSSKLISS